MNTTAPEGRQNVRSLDAGIGMESPTASCVDTKGVGRSVQSDKSAVQLDNRSGPVGPDGHPEPRGAWLSGGWRRQLTDQPAKREIRSTNDEGSTKHEIRKKTVRERSFRARAAIGCSVALPHGRGSATLTSRRSAKSEARMTKEARSTKSEKRPLRGGKGHSAFTTSWGGRAGGATTAGRAGRRKGDRRACDVSCLMARTKSNTIGSRSIGSTSSLKPSAVRRMSLMLKVGAEHSKRPRQVGADTL